MFFAVPAQAQLIDLNLDLRLIDLDSRVTLQGGRVTIVEAQVAAQADTLVDLSAAHVALTGRVDAIDVDRAAQDALLQGVGVATAANTTAITAIVDNAASQATVVAGLGSTLQGTVDALASLDTRVGANGASIADLDVRIGEVAGAGTALADRLDVVAGATAANTAGLAALDTRVSANGAAIADLDVRIGEVAGAGAALADRVVVVEAGTAANGAAIAALGGRTDANTQAIAGHGVLLADLGSEVAAATRVNGEQNAVLANHEVRIVGAQATGDAALALNGTLRTQIEAGAIGLVRQERPSAAITVGAMTGGTTVDFAGTAGPRRLTGIAAGVDAGDAATVGQVAGVAADTLRSANAYTDRAVAGAFGQAIDAASQLMRDNNRALAADMNALAANGAALAGLPQAFVPGAGMAGASIGGHGSEVSLALGLSKASDGDRPTVFKAGAAIDTRRGEVTYNAGVGFHF